MRLDDPLTHDETEQFMREDESIREQRWNEFRDECVRIYRAHEYWPDVVARVSDAMDMQFNPHVAQFEMLCRNFAETEGWPGVLIALAQALRQTERQ